MRPSRSSPIRILTHVLLWGWAVVCLLPMYWLGLASITPVEDLARGARYLPFVDFSPSLAAWRFILSDPAENLVGSFLNSLLAAGVAAMVATLAAGLAIYGVTRFPVRRPVTGFLERPLIALILATRLVPPVLVALPVYMLAQMTGLLDTHGLIIGVYTAFNLPVALLLLMPVFGTRPMPEEEAAQLDGASHAEICFGILFPMLRTPLAVTGLLIFLLCWNEYLFAAYVTAGDTQTLTVWMAGQLSMKEAQAGGEAEELSHMAAAAVLMAFPALMLAAAIQRHLSRAVARLGA